MPSQQATTRSALMEGVEQTNTVIVRELGQEIGAPPRRDPYVMEVDRGRNYYACGRFGHLACHCRNWGRVAERRKLEYERLYEYENNLKGEENLGTLN